MRVQAEVVGETSLHRNRACMVEGVGGRLINIVLKAKRVEKIGSGRESSGASRRDCRTQAEEARIRCTGYDQRSFELVDVAIAREMKAARKEIAQFQRRAISQVSLNTRACLVCRRSFVVRLGSEAYLQGRSRSGCNTKLH